MDVLLSLIPYSVITFLLSYYVSLQEIFDSIKQQAIVSIDALQSSFEDKYIEFYKMNNTTFIPVVATNKKLYNSEPTWIYNLKTKTFTLEEIGGHTSYPIPFIGASVSYKRDDDSDITPIGDLSEWIMDQTIKGPDGVLPLQVLVGAWRYIHDKTLMISYDGFLFSGITCDGEEVKYDLKTENEIVEE